MGEPHKRVPAGIGYAHPQDIDCLLAGTDALPRHRHEATPHEAPYRQDPETRGHEPVGRRAIETRRGEGFERSALRGG